MTEAQLATLYVLIVATSILSIITTISALVLWRVAMHPKKEQMSYRDKVDYSKALLDYIRDIVSQVSVLKFRSFMDEHKLELTNRTHYSRLVGEISKTIHDSINQENLDYSNLVFTEQYLDNYIIQSSMMFTKDLLERAISDKIAQRNNVDQSTDHK